MIFLGDTICSFASKTITFAIRKTAPFISEKCCHLAEKVGFLFCGKATAVATCRRHIAKSRLSNPTFRKNKKTVLSDGPLIWQRRWDSFSAEKPRRLQCATGTLPRAAFRIPPSNEKSRPDGRLNFGGEGGIRTHVACYRQLDFESSSL